MDEINFSIKRLEQLVRDLPAYLKSNKPIIGISANHNHVDENTLTHTYCDSIRHAGGIPMIIPQTDDAELILQTLRKCNALVMSGGGDVHSLWWDEEPHPEVGKVDHNKDYCDILLVQGALRQNLPVLGICRGLQLINIALGGALYQDIYSTVGGCINHLQTATRYEVWHKVNISSDGRLKEILGEDTMTVNSFHHQAISRVAESGVVCATSSDGIIEAVDFSPEYNAIGVQWHPEALACEGKSKNIEIFRWLVKEATLYREATLFHQYHLTLDSHVDTPSLLVGNPCADNDIPKVGLNGMILGGIDIVFMAAYVPQGSENGYIQAKEMLKAIDQFIEKSDNRFSLLGHKSDAWHHKHNGRKMICKAVENAYAIGDDISRLKELSDDGVKYITLCHNGDNLICDSAVKSQGTHGGLSLFGREVVKEMNKLGILVDVSHASDNTIRDVLDVSDAPIIASHSSCKSLCKHSRNLSDELMKAIADKGGVIQICMYHGFLREGGASILDFVNHILYAVALVGANHVGIGTDFDGGGEVKGCRSTSDMIRITVELLRRGVSKEQLDGIWGGNILNLIK